MWRCWYCDCTNSEELGRCQYCSGPRRDAKSDGQKGEFKWTYDEEEYWSPYFNYDVPYYCKGMISTRMIPPRLGTLRESPDYQGEREVEEPVPSTYFAPASTPKRWKIFNFFRKEQ